jgi:SM-20-related protein
VTVLDLERLGAAPLEHDPFDFVIVDDFIRPEQLPAILDDFPAIRRHGSFPLAAPDRGGAFGRFAAELEGEPLRHAIEEKFAIDLGGRPTMITVRGHSDGKDGRIHTDSPTKLITMLLYMNRAWDDEGGRLRLLRRPDDLGDCVAEVPPLAGTMVAFRRSDTSFHGHFPHKGERRVVQLNWVVDAAVVRRELGRHGWSARLKALTPFG